jgi:hypothetical protein
MARRDPETGEPLVAPLHPQHCGSCADCRTAIADLRRSPQDTANGLKRSDFLKHARIVKSEGATRIRRKDVREKVLRANYEALMLIAQDALPAAELKKLAAEVQKLWEPVAKSTNDDENGEVNGDE